MELPSGVILLWQFNRKKKWECLEVYSVDSGGWPLTKTKLVNSNERWCYHQFLWTEDETKDFSGRAVVMWDMERGIILVDYNPIHDQEVIWKNSDASQRIRSQRDWYLYVPQGYELHCNSVEKVREHLKNSATAE